MDRYIVARYYGRGNRDYLTEIGGRWGTTCGGSRRGALTFPTREAARAAARKARRCCMGYNHDKGAPARPYPRPVFVELIA